MRISSRFSLGFVLPRRKFRFVHFATYERRKTDEGQQAFEGTIATTHELLDLYVRLSSQAEHTSQLILDGRWEGVSKVRPLLPPKDLDIDFECRTSSCWLRGRQRRKLRLRMRDNRLQLHFSSLKTSLQRGNETKMLDDVRPPSRTLSFSL